MLRNETKHSYLIWITEEVAHDFLHVKQENTIYEKVRQVWQPSKQWLTYASWLLVGYFVVTVTGRRTCSTNRPWLIRQTGPVSSDATMNSRIHANNLSQASPPFPAKSSSTPSFYIWRGGPPGRGTNRPIWQMPGWQAAPSVPAGHENKKIIHSGGSLWLSGRMSRMRDSNWS